MSPPSSCCSRRSTKGPASNDQAVPVLEGALKTSPRQPSFAIPLGNLYLKKGRYDDAVALMSDLLSKSPDLADARLIRAQACSRRQR